MIKMTEIRKLTTQELNKKLEENKKELFNLKFSASTGTLAWQLPSAPSHNQGSQGSQGQ